MFSQLSSLESVQLLLSCHCRSILFSAVSLFCFDQSVVTLHSGALVCWLTIWNRKPKDNRKPKLKNQTLLCKFLRMSYFNLVYIIMSLSLLSLFIWANSDIFSLWAICKVRAGICSVMVAYKINKAFISQSQTGQHMKPVQSTQSDLHISKQLCGQYFWQHFSDDAHNVSTLGCNCWWGFISSFHCKCTVLIQM